MALSGAMSTGISGMKAQMNALNVVGNNVANVNTYGYKPGRVTFRESIYSTEAGGSNGNEVSGGTNPRQIGYGCNISTIDLDMSSMNLEPTGLNGDVAIQGDGFFMVGDKTGVTDPESLLLSRYGDFHIDPEGYLVDGRGNVVYGFVTCNMNDDGTQSGTAGGNGTDVSTQLVPIRLPLASPGNGQEGDADYIAPGTAIFPGVVNGKNDYGTVTGDCISYANLSIGKDGKITCTNGTTKEPVVLGYVALATVTNPGGLTHMSDSYYQALDGCGQMSIYAPDGSLAGRYLNNVKAGDANATLENMLGESGAALMPGFLEASGTDLATEFANMIIYQRGYQANTRIITVTDSMLEELVNIKR